MRSVLALSLVAMLSLMVLAVPAMAADITVTITVVGADGKKLTGAKVVLYNSDGDKFEGTTNINGVVNITVPDNGTYLVVVKDEYYILDTVEVLGDTSKTVDASTMHHVNISSTPASVEAKVLLTAFKYVSVPVKTNVTVYAPSELNITFPKEVVKFPYKYTFDKIKYDGVETNETTVTLDMARDYEVTAYYTKSFYMALEYWMVVVLVVILVVALAVAWMAGARAAKAAIEEWRRKNMRFVRKK